MKNPPPCPNCDQRPWREGHMAELQERDDRPDNRQFCVCMHCSRIWKLCADRWVEPTDDDADAVAMLTPYAVRFLVNRTLGIDPDCLTKPPPLNG